MMSSWSLLLFVLLMSSLASFGWGMSKFFLKPTGDTAGMKVIRAFSTVTALLHLAAILVTPCKPTQSLVAAAMYASGLALFFWAISANRKRSLSAAFSQDLPSHLVTWGPYRMIRHPFYTAYLMAWTAGYLGTGRLWLLPTLAGMIIVYFTAALKEEDKFASSRLAEQYRTYQQCTGRFLPNPAAWWIRRRKESDAASLA